MKYSTSAIVALHERPILKRFSFWLKCDVKHEQFYSLSINFWQPKSQSAIGEKTNFKKYSWRKLLPTNTVWFIASSGMKWGRFWQSPMWWLKVLKGSRPFVLSKNMQLTSNLWMSRTDKLSAEASHLPSPVCTCRAFLPWLESAKKQSGQFSTKMSRSGESPCFFSGVQYVPEESPVLVP